MVLQRAAKRLSAAAGVAASNQFNSIQFKSAFGSIGMASKRMLRTTGQRAFSSGTPDGFAKFATHLMRCNQNCFERIADDLDARNLPRGARVLDLGASAGEPSLTVAARSSGYYVVSTDFAPPNLELGVARAAAFGLSDQAEFHTTDAQDLSAWADNSFDAVVGTYVLMFTPDMPKVCREVHRVLKPGAPFITTVWQPPPMGETG
jgi:SAM-dependent methyltransferase